MYKRLYLRFDRNENGYNAVTYGAREDRYVLALPSGEIDNR